MTEALSVSQHFLMSATDRATSNRIEASADHGGADVLYMGFRTFRWFVAENLKRVNDDSKT
jgi:hypothetical protein